MMMKVFFPNLVGYRDIYFTKFQERKPYIEFFIDFIIVTYEVILKNERCEYACFHNNYAIKF